MVNWRFPSRKGEGKWLFGVVQVVANWRDKVGAVVLLQKMEE